MSTCAAPGCDNPVTRKTRGRPAIYCSPACRPSRWSDQRRPRLVIEVEHPDSSPDGRPPDRVWVVRLRRAQRVVVVADNLGWPSAQALAAELSDLLFAHPWQKGGAVG